MKNVQRNNYRPLPLCDTHFHLIYPETVESTINIFREITDYFDISRITMNCISCGSGHRSIDFPNNVKGIYVRDRLNEARADSAFVYGSFTHLFDGTDTAESYLAQIKRLYDIGFDGFKMLEGKPEFRKKLGHPLCDEIFDKSYAFMEEAGFPVKMHLGDPYTAWGPKESITPYALSRGWWYGDGTYPSFEELHEEVYGVMKKFPKLKLCLAHFFFLGHNTDELRRFFDTYENVSVDLTPGASMFKGFTEHYNDAVKFFEDYPDRIFFGSDTYNRPVEGDAFDKYKQSGDAGHRINLVRHCLEKSEDMEIEEGRLGFFKPLNLSDKVLRDIYYGNHTRLHPAVRNTDKALARAYAEEMLEIINCDFHKFAVPEEKETEEQNLRTIIGYYS